MAAIPTEHSVEASRLDRLPLRGNAFSLAIAVALMLLTWALYARTIGFDFVSFDDHTYIFDNAHVTTGLTLSNVRWAFSTLFFANWHPLVWIAYQSIDNLFGLNPAAYHALNFLLHGASAAMLFWFLLRATGRLWPSAFAAALFAWHPLRVESVAWISETKDCLCCFFWLATMLAYQRYVARPGPARYLLVMLTTALALASKATAITIPCTLLLLDFWPLRQAQTPRRWLTLIVEKLPLAAMAAGGAIPNFRAQRAMHAALLDSLIPLPQRIANAVVSVGAYLRDTLWPTRLCIFYPHPTLVGLPIPIASVIVSAAIILLITAGCLCFARRRPFLIVGWLWFLGTLLPTIGLLQVGAQSRADRYTYIPSIGISITIAGALASRRAYNMALAGGGVVLLIVLATATELQLSTWQNTTTLFTRASVVTQRNYLAMSELSDQALASGDSPLALDLATQAVAICPALPGPHRALAAALEQVGQYLAAQEQWTIAIRSGGDEASTRDRLGSVLVKMNRPADAAREFRTALRYDPTDGAALSNLGLLLADQGNLDQAIRYWRHATIVAPTFGPAHGWLGDALQQRGDRAGAITQYRAAKAAGERRPQWLTSLAWLLATDPTTASGAAEAVETARAACDATHNHDALALDALAAALARAGQYDAAATTAANAAAIAKSAGQLLLANGIERRMMAYRAGQPFIAPAARPIDGNR